MSLAVSQALRCTGATFVVALVASACRPRSPTIDYRSADPVTDARRAVIDSGHFHTLAVKVGDSVISPSDTTVLRVHSYNVQVGPEGPIIYLPVQSAPNRPGWPSEDQLRYMKRYNTELFALLDTNAMPPSLPPNKRLKLSGGDRPK